MFTAIALVCAIDALPFKDCAMMHSPVESKAEDIFYYERESDCTLAAQSLFLMTIPGGPLDGKYIADFHCLKWNPVPPGSST